MSNPRRGAAIACGGCRRSAVRFAPLIALLVVVGVFSVYASSATTSPSGVPAANAAPACPFPGGVIRAFTTIDTAGTTGDLGLGTHRAEKLSVELINRRGGILGCRLVIDVAEEGFPDVDVCLRKYREALGSRRYAFFFGPTGSGCMASVTALTNAAKKAIIANQAADHQPFFNPKFQKYNFHAAVSTFLEGRASAKFSISKGWRVAAILAPNYAYGQDAARGFVDYFKRNGGRVVAQQFPEFDEKNFTPFINAVVRRRPQMVFSAFFAGFVIPFWKQWQDGGHDRIPAIGGLIDTPGWELVKRPNQIPKNSYAYDRGAWQLLAKTPTGKQFQDAYVRKHGRSAHPVPLSWGQAFWSGVLMAKALIEKTRSLEADDWVEAVEKGDFTFRGPYHVGPTPVNPVNHMADNCAQVGLLTYNRKLRVKASYDLKDFQNICMHDILTNQEARRITTNSDVSAGALAAYSRAVAAVKRADRRVALLVASG
jgi:ABC-type branched-subunit amino acid transport system substrate-binding protein